MKPLTARACNQPLSADSGAPDWIQLLPAGPAIVGSDGRAWNLPDPHALVAAFAARNKPLVVDWEHASEHRAPQGLDAPAAGWIDQIEDRNGAIWGHVEWTAKAAAQIAAKEYRFLSPVFTYQKPDSRIMALLSAGLTNQPNLNLTALNQEQPPMDLTEICKALGLAPDAGMPAILAAIKALQDDESAEPDAQAIAAQHAQPLLTKFVPRPDYDAALQRAANAEQQLAVINKARKEQDIAALIDTALQARQISPATQDYYRAMCQTDGGIVAFKDFLSHAPALIGDATGLAGTPPEPPAEQILTRAFNRHAPAK